MAIWNRVNSLIFGGAIGAAARTAIEPQIEPARQKAWGNNKNRILEPGTLARLVAQGLTTEEAAQDEAGRSGYDENKVAALIQLALTSPGLGPLDELLNRGTITVEQFHHALAKAQIEPQFWPALLDRANDKLSPAEIANAIQQGHLPNPDVLPDVSPSVPPIGGQVHPLAPDGGAPSHVPLTQIDIDPLEELKASGLNKEQLEVIANLSGLPPGAETLLTMWNRGLIDESSVDAGIREGHIKTKWAGAFKRMAWAVLGAAEFASAHLRGWITVDEMYAGGRLTGHTKEQMDLLYLNRGRPLAPVQAYTAWARKSPGPTGPGYERGPHPFDEQDFLRALQQSDVRTEYGPTLWANRHAYPPLFQLGRLVTAGALTPERARVILGYERYEQQDIDSLVTFWSGGARAATSPYVGKALNQLWTTTHRAYVAEETDREQAEAVLNLLLIDADSLDTIFAAWDGERVLRRAEPSAAEVKKLYKKGTWTHEEATTRLVQMGWSLSDANDFLTT